MYDVKTQLRNLLEETPAVTFDEIIAAASPKADTDRLQPQQVNPRRGFLVAIGTAAAVLLVVGVVGGVLLTGGSTDHDPVAPSVTSTIPAEPPTTAAPDSDPGRLITGEAVNPWTATEITEPWARDVVDVAVLPEGGFAVASRYEGGVFWSRDGVSWQDANPDGLASLPVWPDDDNLRVITGLSDRLAVLDSSEPVVWLGDLITREWESIALDWEDTVPFFDRMVIASSNDAILVVGSYQGRNELDGRTLVWLIDPDTRRVERVALPPGFLEAASAGRWNRSGLEAAWFGDRWVVAVGDSTAVSLDGLTWTTNRDTDGLASGDRYIASLAAGSNGLMATTCEWAHRSWFSEDGLTWTQTFAETAGHYGAYSDSLGFVVAGERVFTSVDGRAWEWTLGPQLDHNIIDTAASGNNVFILTKTHSTAAVPYVMTLDQAGI